MDAPVTLELELQPDAAAMLDAAPYPGEAASGETQRTLWLDTADRRLMALGAELRGLDRQADDAGTASRAPDNRDSGAEGRNDLGGGAVDAGEVTASDAALVTVADPAAELRPWALSVLPLLPADRSAASLLGAPAAAELPLRIQARAALDRRLWQLEGEDGPVGLERLDGSLSAGKPGKRQTATALHLLRITAANATAAFVFARRIDRLAPVRLSVAGLAERGQALAKPGAAVKATPLVLGPEDSAGEAFRRIATACLRQYRLNETQLLEGARGDVLHQSRVALRRLRSAFWIFRPMLAGEDLLRFNAAFRDLAGAFGQARDLDVLILKRPDLPRDRLETAREAAYAAVAATLAAAESRALILDFAEWVETGDWRAPHAPGAGPRDTTARDFAASALRRLLHRLARKGKGFATLSDESRHDLRKDAKKLRYATDFFASLFEDPRARRRQEAFVTALAQLQDELGDLNDLAAAGALLEHLGLASEAPPPRPADRAALLAIAERSLDALLELRPFWRGA